MSNKILLLAAIVGLAAWIVAQWPFRSNVPVTLREAPQGGDFTLQAASGPFELQAQRGKVVLIYFGYTFCPDICPTNLMLMAQALNALDEDELARVQGVFISVDPPRDTLERLASYTTYFHPAIIGVTGRAEDLANIASQYGAAYRKVEGESQGGYLIDHSGNTYIVAPDGALHTILPHATAPQDIVRVVRSLLNPTRNR